MPVSSNRAAATGADNLGVDQSTVPFESETVKPAAVSVTKPELDVGLARLADQITLVVGL